ncbi:hypothetical protein EJ08DRAFT_735308 [Tothia fuscella]|uniref:Uncharacterized protein n=1 Tax=Tothia fuscella TaxID=1048955 RepID=A0A9P4NNV1_9PEZI|nr:hypothetical protein EJ08DRAFT_735308 [Tothia fuscella]
MQPDPPDPNAELRIQCQQIRQLEIEIEAAEDKLRSLHSQVHSSNELIQELKSENQRLRDLLAGFGRGDSLAPSAVDECSNVEVVNELRQLPRVPAMATPTPTPITPDSEDSVRIKIEGEDEPLSASPSGFSRGPEVPSSSAWDHPERARHAVRNRYGANAMYELQHGSAMRKNFSFSPDTPTPPNSLPSYSQCGDDELLDSTPIKQEEQNKDDDNDTEDSESPKIPAMPSRPPPPIPSKNPCRMPTSAELAKKTYSNGTLVFPQVSMQEFALEHNIPFTPSRSSLSSSASSARTIIHHTPPRGQAESEEPNSIAGTPELTRESFNENGIYQPFHARPNPNSQEKSKLSKVQAQVSQFERLRRQVSPPASEIIHIHGKKPQLHRANSGRKVTAFISARTPSYSTQESVTFSPVEHSATPPDKRPQPRRLKRKQKLQALPSSYIAYSTRDSSLPDLAGARISSATFDHNIIADAERQKGSTTPVNDEEGRASTTPDGTPPRGWDKYVERESLTGDKHEWGHRMFGVVVARKMEALSRIGEESEEDEDGGNQESVATGNDVNNVGLEEDEVQSFEETSGKDTREAGVAQDDDVNAHGDSDQIEEDKPLTPAQSFKYLATRDYQSRSRERTLSIVSTTAAMAEQVELSIRLRGNGRTISAPLRPHAPSVSSNPQPNDGKGEGKDKKNEKEEEDYFSQPKSNFRYILDQERRSPDYAHFTDNGYKIPSLPDLYPEKYAKLNAGAKGKVTAPTSDVNAQVQVDPVVRKLRATPPEAIEHLQFASDPSSYATAAISVPVAPSLSMDEGTGYPILDSKAQITTSTNNPNPFQNPHRKSQRQPLQYIFDPRSHSTIPNSVTSTPTPVPNAQATPSARHRALDRKLGVSIRTVPAEGPPQQNVGLSRTSPLMRGPRPVGPRDIGNESVGTGNVGGVLGRKGSIASKCMRRRN